MGPGVPSLSSLLGDFSGVVVFFERLCRLMKG